MFDALDEEQRLMDERMEESPRIEKAVSLDDPIGSLELQPLTVAKTTTTVNEALAMMAENDVGCALVTDEDGKLVGIFTERDLIRRACGKCPTLDKIKLDKVMTSDPTSLQSEDTLAFALNRMCEQGYRHVPIVDQDEKPSAFVSMRDIVHHLGCFYRKEVWNLPPEPVHRMRRREAG